MDETPGVLWPRPKFRHRYRTHIILFLATLLTTTLAGVLNWEAFDSGQDRLTWSLLWSHLAYGLIYSIPMLLVLGAHEFGHYYYCRRHDVDASLPYFLPAPLLLTGTFGAVIRIKQPFPSKRALFDIGIAGPIAGFLMLLPFLFWGVAHSIAVQIPQGSDIVYFGEPLLLKFAEWLYFPAMPDGADLVLHPVGFAAWFGLLATALNLLPFGQLDGGHIAYAVFGSRARLVSIGTLLATVALTFTSMSWTLTAMVMLAMAFFLGVRHPHIPDEDVLLDTKRLLVAFLALVIFVLCFTPVPIQFISGS